MFTNVSGETSRAAWVAFNGPIKSADYTMRERESAPVNGCKYSSRLRMIRVIIYQSLDLLSKFCRQSKYNQ